jgi:hypothetical protein
MQTPAVSSRACMGLVLALFTATAGTACTGGVTLVRRLTCSTTLVQQEPSPDGARVASLYRVNCGGAMNHFEGIVFLSDHSATPNPLDFENAQSVLYPFASDTSIIWRDDLHLTVRCPSCPPERFKKRDAMWKEVMLLYEGHEGNAVLLPR